MEENIKMPEVPDDIEDGNMSRYSAQNMDGPNAHMHTRTDVPARYLHCFI